MFKNNISSNIYGKISILRYLRTANFYDTAKFPNGEISVRRNFLRRNFLSVNFLCGGISLRKSFLRRNFPRRNFLQRGFLAPAKTHLIMFFIQGKIHNLQTMFCASYICMWYFNNFLLVFELPGYPVKYQDLFLTVLLIFCVLLYLLKITCFQSRFRLVCSFLFSCNENIFKPKLPIFL